MDRQRYQQHLGSNYWWQVRKAISARSGGQCERCRISAAEHVHHVTYAHVGHELDHLDDLIHMCSDCHRCVHNKSDYDPKLVTGADWFEVMMRRLREL